MKGSERWDLESIDHTTSSTGRHLGRWRCSLATSSRRSHSATSRHRRKITTCTYLVDAYCLGVKNAMGPDEMDDRGLRSLAGFAFSAYSGAPVNGPIDLVRELVLGAVEYARELGFEPHLDFERARPHLGPWKGPSSITFGRDGRPHYINGPDDDPEYVLRTLRRTVGDGGFDQTVAFDLDDLRMAG